MKEQNVNLIKTDIKLANSSGSLDIEMDIGPIATPPPVDDIDNINNINNINIINSNDNQNKNQNENINDNINDNIPSAPDLSNLAQINNNNINNNNGNQFVYGNELKQLRDMGLESGEHVKTLLIKHKGQINRVVQV